MLAARGPFGLCSTSYCTLSFSFSVLKPLAWMDEKCTKRSLLPSSGVMKPKPLASLNHFTVPVLMFFSLKVNERREACGRSRKKNQRVSTARTATARPDVSPLENPAHPLYRDIGWKRTFCSDTSTRLSLFSLHTKFIDRLQ